MALGDTADLLYMARDKRLTFRRTGETSHA
jgi:hypothetical protein